jgi:PAS domain S-box-containing protein
MMAAENAEASATALRAQVRAEQVRGLYARAAMPLLTNVVNSSLLAYIFYEPELSARIFGWLAGYYVLTAARLLAIRAYRRAAPAGADAARWGWLFAASVLVSGMLWGSTAFLFYRPGDVVGQAVILLVLGGMTAGAAGSTATFFPAFVAFAAPAIAPFTVRLFLEPDRLHLALGVMVGLFAVAMAQVARTGEQRLTEAAELRFKNAALANDVMRAGERLAAVNDELEGRVTERTAELVGAVEQHERVEEALRRQKEVLEKIFDHSPVMLVMYDATGRVELVNREFERRLGWTREDLEAHPEGLELHEGAAQRLSLRAYATSGDTSLRDFTSLAKDGRRLHVSWASVRLSDGVVIAIGQDVTEQRKARDAVAVSERMASVGTLAAGVAHEINNPLAFVLSNLDFSHGSVRAALEEDPAMPLDQRERLRKTLDALSDAQVGAIRVRNIVRDLNTFSRGAEEVGGAVDLIDVLETSIRMAVNEIRHRARIVRRFEAVPLVGGQGGKLGQVFLNLLLNAAHAIPEGNASKNEVAVAARTDGSGRAVVEVRDTGVGIPAEVLPRILDPFFTTKRVGSGMGLGLSICHGIVSSLGGKMEVESKVGVGSVFRVLLPPGKQERRDAAKPPTPPPTVRRRVLVIDDEPLFGSTVARMIEAEHDVTVETTAQGALARLAAGEAFDVILCDLMMPDVSGMEFYERLMRNAPGVAKRIIFTTGGAFTDAARTFLDRVPNARLAKPFTRRELAVVLESVSRDGPS